MSSVLGTLASPAAATVQLLPLLADAAIKGVVVFGIAAGAVVMCRRRSAATRHAIWAGAVVAQLALPVLSALLPAWRVPLANRLERRLVSTPNELVMPALAEHVIFVPGSEAADAPRVIIGGTGGTVWSSGRMARAGARAVTSYGPTRFVTRPARLAAIDAMRMLRNRTPVWWLRAIAIVWLMGALGIFARFVAGTLAVSRLARRSERVDDGRWLALAQRIASGLGVARPMTLLRSGRFGVPVTWGVVYPIVLLPDDADEWTEQRRRYVLVHETAHVKRVDAFTQLLAQLGLAAFWFDPFVWIAAHRMRVEREHACDDYVLREGTPASTYAADLLAMVRALGGRGHAAQPAFAALAMARPADLEERMHAILDPKQDRGPLTRGSALALALGVMLLVLPLAAFTPFGGRPARFAIRPVARPMVFAIPEPARAPMPVVPPEMLSDIQAGVRGAAAARDVERAIREARPALSALEATIASAASMASGASSAAGASVATSRASSSAGAIGSCSSVSLRRTGSSVSVHSSDDDNSKSYQYISSSAGRCLQLALWGHVEFGPDSRDVKQLSRDGMLYLRERRSDVDRELQVTPDDDGSPRYAYREDGEQASFNDDARAWLGEVLPEILRESGLNAPERVARLRKQGGVAAVLADIEKTQSTSAKRAAYEALLRQGQLSDKDVEHVLSQAGDELSSSDSELRALLAEMGHSVRMSAAALKAAGAAMEHISSDDDKRALLEQYALQGNRDMLCIAIAQAKSISSDNEKGAFLRATASRYLASDDDELRSGFFATARSISSDEEKRATLAAALPYAKRQSVLIPLLDVAQEISSDGEKAELLVAIAKQGLVASGPPREAFMRATRSLSSDSEYRRVMEVAINR
jgi:beta-lactamase regulating signal transducer with metallopeptidase domain